MELADQERPLLRRLYKEAPGTFEHTLMICGLAEEGARTIGRSQQRVFIKQTPGSTFLDWKCGWKLNRPGFIGV